MPTKKTLPKTGFFKILITSSSAIVLVFLNKLFRIVSKTNLVTHAVMIVIMKAYRAPLSGDWGRVSIE